MQPLFVEARRAIDPRGDCPWCSAQILSQMRVSSARSLDDDQHTAAAPGEVADQRVNLRLGGHINALGRFVEQQHADLARQPFGEDHLLLVAARQRRAGSEASRGRISSSSMSSATTRSPAARSRVASAGNRSRLGNRMLSRTDRFTIRPSRRSPGTIPMPERMASAGLRGCRPRCARGSPHRRRGRTAAAVRGRCRCRGGPRVPQPRWREG